MASKRIHCEIPIEASPEKVWDILSEYGNVSAFHGAVVESHSVEGSGDIASLGCERVCNIVDMGLKITLKERIVDYEEGRSYRYEVYDWRNFPIQKMLFGFTILGATSRHTQLAIDIEYLARPALLTPLMAGKMRRLARDVLLGYKHYTETGERRVPVRDLKARYRVGDRLETPYG